MPLDFTDFQTIAASSSREIYRQNGESSERADGRSFYPGGKPPPSAHSPLGRASRDETASSCRGYCLLSSSPLRPTDVDTRLSGGGTSIEFLRALHFCVEIKITEGTIWIQGDILTRPAEV